MCAREGWLGFDPATPLFMPAGGLMDGPKRPTSVIGTMVSPSPADTMVATPLPRSHRVGQVNEDAGASASPTREG